MKKQQFLDGVYKIKRGIERLDTSEQFYRVYMSGVDRFDIKTRQEKRHKKGANISAITAPLIVKPEEEQQ